MAVTLITSCRCYPSRRGHSPALIPVRCRRLCSASTLRAPHSCCCVAYRYLQVALEATPRNLTKKYPQTPRPPLPLPPPPPTSPLLHPLLSPLLRIENCALLYPTVPYCALHLSLSLPLFSYYTNDLFFILSTSTFRCGRFIISNHYVYLPTALRRWILCCH